jgi:hypothetical protein
MSGIQIDLRFFDVKFRDLLILIPDIIIIYCNLKGPLFLSAVFGILAVINSVIYLYFRMQTTKDVFFIRRIYDDIGDEE